MYRKIKLEKRSLFKFDSTNPRKADDARLSLLRLSIKKIGFVMPLYATKDGMLLSGHQRTTVVDSLGIDVLPIERVDIAENKIRGINIVFNRCTNDFGALDTGGDMKTKIHFPDLIAELDKLPDLTPRQWPVNKCVVEDIIQYGSRVNDRYDKKAIVVANNLLREDIKIPIVVTESGNVVNGVARIFAALESGVTEWPVVKIPDRLAELASKLLNYLSMDFNVSGDMADLLRACAFRRPQNARGSVPKAMRFWASGERTLSDKLCYGSQFWDTFRNTHGTRVLDFGSGLSRSAPFLRKQGILADDFEPYMIDPSADKSVPCVRYSRARAREFLDNVADGRIYDSIFLCSVLNSVPFAKDRLMVLCIVHALCGYGSRVYGTCRDISDHGYEYSGIRQANYFVFDSEPGVRIGDYMANPKIQKFHTQDEAAGMLSRFWEGYEFCKGGNVFYFKAWAPKQPNLQALVTSLLFEFNLPYKDGETMGLGIHALKCFGKRLGVDLLAVHQQMQKPQTKEAVKKRKK